MGGGAHRGARRAGGPSSAGGGGSRCRRGGRRLACRGDRLEDPVPQPGDPGVDPRPPGFRTADAPADDAGQEEPARGLLADQGASRVTLGDRGTPSGGSGSPGSAPNPRAAGTEKAPWTGPLHTGSRENGLERSHPRTCFLPCVDGQTLGPSRALLGLPLAANHPAPVSAPQWVPVGRPPWWG